MLKEIIVLIKEKIFNLFKPRKLKHETFIVHEFDNFCEVQCKNCEEYLGQDSGEIHPHGKWKKISNKFIFFKFNEEIKFREKKYGYPLPIIQKLKAARKISHNVYPTFIIHNRGKNGHLKREILRRNLLNSVGVNYKIR